MIARLQDAQGRVVIPGLYDRVRDVPAHERRDMAASPHGSATCWLTPGTSGQGRARLHARTSGPQSVLR